ncbi:alpha/beta hydrolase, partial [Mycobacterium tuberculosis]|nr:alpha/beta hydrolase [Mycobacterium tuberculosis]
LAARDRQDLLGRMVLIGQYYNDDGKVAASPLTALLDSERAMSGLRSQYAALSPDGADHFATFDAKMKHLFATEPRIDLNSLTSITTPTMVLLGDRDEVTLDHCSAVGA